MASWSRASARSRSGDARTCGELGLDEADPRRGAPQGTPVLGICLGMQLLFDRSEELEPTAGLGLIPGEVTRLETGGLRIPHIGWNEVSFERLCPLTAGLPAAGRPFYHVHSLAARPRTTPTSSRPATYGETFATIVGRGLGATASSSTPRSPPADGLELLRAFVALCGSGARRGHDGGWTRMILLPAIDILDGKAVRLARGDFEQRTVYDADPLDAARRWAQTGARALHVVDLDGARGGRSGESRARPPDRLRDRRARSGRRRAADDRSGPGCARGRRGPGRARERRRSATSTSSTRRSPSTATGSSCRSTLRDGRLAASGWTEQTEIPVEAVIESLGRRGVTRFVYSSIERDGMLCGPDLDEVVRIAQVVRGTFVYSGGISSLADLSALASLRQVNLTGVIVGKALYERRFEVGPAQAALDAGGADGPERG